MLNLLAATLEKIYKRSFLASFFQVINAPVV